MRTTLIQPTRRLVCTRKTPANWDYQLLGPDSFSVNIRLDSIRKDGAVVIGDKEYLIRRRGYEKYWVIFERDNPTIGAITNTSQLNRKCTLVMDGSVLEIKVVGLLGINCEIKEGENMIGVAHVPPISLWKSPFIECIETLPIHVQVTAFWAAMGAWRDLNLFY